MTKTNEADKRYIQEHWGRQSVKEISSHLGIKESKVRKLAQKFEKKSPAKTNTHKNYRYLPEMIILAVVGLWVYAQSLSSGFHYDDEYTIVKNAYICNLMDLPAIFNAFNTRFVLGWTLALNYAIGKLDPVGYHLGNLFLHIFNSILVYWLVRLTLCSRRFKETFFEAQARPFSFFCALIFLVHPLQTQAVVYIWQRAAVLATTCYLLSFVSYAFFRLTHRKSWLITALVVCTIGMFTKEIMITAPLGLLLYEALFFKNEGAQERQLAVFLFLLTMPLIPLMMTRADQITLKIMRPESVADSEVRSGIDMTRFVSDQSMTRADYWRTELNVTRTYFRLFFYPAGQNLDYDYPIAKTWDMDLFISGVFIAALLISAVLAFRTLPLFAFGVFWIFLTLLPEALVIQNDVIYEHRLYLPLFGFSLAFISLSSALFRLQKKPLTLVMACVAIALSFVSVSRIKIWADEISLWSDVVRKSPLKARGFHNLGVEYSNKKEYSKALECFLKAIENERQYAKNHNGTFSAGAALSFMSAGEAYFREKDYSKAIACYEEALDIELKVKLNPYKIYLNLANLYAETDRSKAPAFYLKAIECAPREAKVYYNAGTFFLEQKNASKAIEYLSQLVLLDPQNVEGYNNLGNAYFLAKRYSEAAESYRKALSLDPRAELARDNLKLAEERIKLRSVAAKP